MKMGEALLDLEQVLRSKREQLTLQEANVLLAWRAQAMRDFTVGFGGASVVTWLATRRIINLWRVNLTLGAAAVCGLWRFGRSVESSAEHILSLEGSRLQRELANIMLKKYHNDPWVLQRLSRRFYSEEVYIDSSGDRPILRWRFRNFFGDPITHSQSTSHSEETEAQNNDVKKTNMEPKQVHVHASHDTTEDPFDLILEHPARVETVPHPDTPTTPSRRQRRREKRSHRRRRRQHLEEPDI